MTTILQNRVISIFGRKGSGKSTLARRLCRYWPRVFAFDSQGEYSAPDFEVHEGLEAGVAAMLASRARPLCWKSFRLADGNQYLDLARVAFEIPGTLVLVEEASLYTSPSNLPFEMSQLVRYGRHRLIDQIYIARRPFEVHRELTAASDVIVSFQQTEPRDVKYLRERIGPEAEAVRALDADRYEFAVWGQPSKMPWPLFEQYARGHELHLTTEEGPP